MKQNQIIIISIISIAILIPIGYLVLNPNLLIKENMDVELVEEDMMMMHNMDIEESLDDQGFIEAMIAHHQEAVDSSEILVEKGTKTELKKLAQDIKDNQSKEISDMKLWYKEWFTEEFAIEGEYMTLMRDLNSFEDVEEMEQVYIEDMILHHQGAISMAENILESTERQELVDFANSILNVQKREIEILEGLKINN